MSVGEFGSDFNPTASGLQEVTFFSESGSALADGIAGPVPVGQTWVLDGVDFYGQVSDDDACYFTITGPNGNVTFALSVVCTNASHTLYCGYTWRGAMPFGRGQSLQAAAFSNGHPVSFGVTGWGHIDFWDAY